MRNVEHQESYEDEESDMEYDQVSYSLISKW